MTTSEALTRHTRLISPLGAIVLVAEGDALSWLCLEGQRHFPDLTVVPRQDDLMIFKDAAVWLADYFEGRNPPCNAIPIAPSGSRYQRTIWSMLQEIPYGKTVSYGELARTYAERHGTRPCAQAVGGAVGRNPLAILIPCHRVVGANHTLGGYGGGLEAKQFLLRLEAGVKEEASRG